jgi:cytochrome c oxidase assembly protein subunit 11
VECFCFEEQKLLAGEEVDLPVFFFIDSDVLDDPSTKGVDDVVLSYTFFSARRNPKNGQLECVFPPAQALHTRLTDN